MMEDARTEFKREYTDTIRKSVLAFTNTEGGCLYVGIDDGGQVIGVADADDVQKRIVSLCRDGIRPEVMMFLSCDRIMIENKPVVRVQVQRGTDCPYYLTSKGIRPEGVYVRRGSANIPASLGEIRKMIREAGDYRYEQERSLEQALTFEETEKFFARAEVSLGEAQMRTLGLISADGQYTNLGLLLSEQCQHTVKAAIFSGRKQEVFRNRREFSGSILSQVNGLIEYLDYYNEVHSEIHGMRRIDSRNYPVEALREAVFNAMVHRDYGFSGSTLVSLYEDRLEILSLGGLAEGVTYQDMMMGVSIQRNPKLAEVFFRLHYIEAFGTGVHRILRAYEGCARQPEFLVSDNAVKVILPNIHYEEDVSAVDKVKEPGAVYESFARNADDIRVCEAIANGVDSRRALQETMGFSLTKTVNILRRLQDEMKIVRLGKGKNSRYIVRS